MDDENLPQPIDQTVPSTPAHSEPPITETSGEAELAQHMELLSEGDESAVSTESAEQLDTISGGANPQGEPPSDELDDTLPLNVNAEARINDTIISRDKLLSQEQKLVKLDRLLLTEGIHLLVILPAVGTLMMFMAWFNLSSSPEWWLNSAEGSLGINFATATSLLAFVIFIGHLITLVIVRQRYVVTHKIFRLETKRYRLEGRPLESMHGTSTLKNHTSGVIQQRNMAIGLVACLLIIDISALWVSLMSNIASTLVLLATSFGLFSIGHHLVLSRRPYNASERWGLIDAYDPPIHPATLDRVWTDLLTTHMDPRLASQFEEFLVQFNSSLRQGISPIMATERFLALHYFHREGLLNTKLFRNELLKIIRDETWESIAHHSVFDEELWTHLLRRVTERVPAFFRLVERLRSKLKNSLNDMNQRELIFDVDMENIVFDSANLFCLLFNNSDVERKVVIRILSPDFRPSNFSFTCALKPGKGIIMSSDNSIEGVMLADEGLNLMSNLLDMGTFVWQTLLPERLGEATVTIRLEEMDGDLISGRQINVRVRSEYNRRLSTGTGVLSFAIGIIVFASALLKQFGFF